MFDFASFANLFSDPAKLDLMATQAAQQMDPNSMLPAIEQAKMQLGQLAQGGAQAAVQGPGPNLADAISGAVQGQLMPGAGPSGPLTPTQQAAMGPFVQQPQPGGDMRTAMMALGMMNKQKPGQQRAPSPPPAASANVRGGSPMIAAQQPQPLPFSQPQGLPPLAVLLRGGR